MKDTTKLLLVDTVSMTPICWVHDMNTAIEYLSHEPERRRRDFALYAYFKPVKYRPVPPIPLVDTKVDRVVVAPDGTATYYLTPVGICECDRDDPGCHICVGDCPDGQLPDGPVCPKCGEERWPSGIDGGTWVHKDGAK